MDRVLQSVPGCKVNERKCKKIQLCKKKKILNINKSVPGGDVAGVGGGHVHVHLSGLLPWHLPGVHLVSLPVSLPLLLLRGELNV